MKKFNWEQTGMPEALVNRLERPECRHESKGPPVVTPEDLLNMKPKPAADQEWEDWERKFQSLLG